MTPALRSFVAGELAVPVPVDIVSAGREIAGRLGGVAVLFYGSVLRTDDVSGVLDFYVLVPEKAGPRWLWPTVSYHEVAVAGRTLRAKVAAMTLDTFRRAAGGDTLDTTIWARFVQPSALVWAAGPDIRDHVVDAVAAAAVTAARFAAALGPRRGEAGDYWRALFRETYTAELRVERPGREDIILAHDFGRYDALLPLAWAAGGIAFRRDGAALVPGLTADQSRRTVAAWWPRQRVGKLLNVARLVKAAFTFDGAARYALWKVERHTGVRLALTPWRENHPILAAPGALWRIWWSLGRR